MPNRKPAIFVLVWVVFCLFASVSLLGQEASSATSTAGSDTGSLSWDMFWNMLYFFLILIVVGVLVGALVALLVSRQHYSGVIGFALIGGFVGLMAGMSETPVVGPVVTASLVFLGGVVAYLLGSDKVNESAQPMIKGALIGFGTLMIFGVLMGSTLRLGPPWIQLAEGEEGDTDRLYLEGIPDVDYVIKLSKPLRTTLTGLQVYGFDGEFFFVERGQPVDELEDAYWFDDKFVVRWEPFGGVCTNLEPQWARVADGTKENGDEAFETLEIVFPIETEQGQLCEATIPPEKDD